jgi:very-short-patch-repair endonuclease
MGKTIHDAIWACQNRRSIIEDPALRGFDIPGPENLTLTELETSEAALDRFESREIDIETEYGTLRDHPWSWVGKPVDPFSRDLLIDALRDYVQSLGALAELRHQVQLIGIETGLDSPGDLAHLLEFIDRIPEIDPNILPSLLPALADPHVREVIYDLSVLIAERNQLLDSMAPTVEVSALTEHLHTIAEHLRQMPPRIDSYLRLRQVPSTLDVISSDMELIRKSETQLATLASAFGLSHELTGPQIDLATFVAELTSRTEDRALELRSDRLSRPGALDDLISASNVAKGLLAQRATLAQQFRLDGLSTNSNLLEDAVVLKSTRWLGRNFSTYRKARRTWISLARSDHEDFRARSKNPMDMSHDLEELAAYSSKVQEFNNDPRLHELVTIGFRGLDTDLEPWIEAAYYLNTVRSKAQDEVGDRIWNVAKNGSDADLLSIKRVVSSGTTTHLQAAMQSLGLGPDETLRRRLSDLEALYTWWNRFGEIGALIGLNGEAQPVNIAGIIESAHSYLDVCQRIDQSQEALQVLKANGVDQSDLVGIQSTLEYSDALTAAFPNDQPIPSSFLFSADVLRIVDSLTVCSSQLSEWLSKESMLLAPIEEVASIGFAEDDLTVARRSYNYLGDRFARSLSSSDSLGSWVGLIEATATCAQLQLSSYVDRYDNARAYRLSEAYRAIYWNSLAKRAFHKHPVLRQFSGETQTRARARFKQLDQEIMQLNRALIASRLRRNSPPVGNREGSRGNWTEMSLIRVLLPRRRPRVTIRDLVRRASRSLLELQPCFMMSPSSVAQFLEPGAIEFDLLIIDEASQMRPEEAIGAIARSRQSVIVGDPMQLPPTAFFNRVDTLDEDLEEDVEDESILDRALASYSPYRELRWHYRSRHQDLIRFSNRHFYENRLIVFPAPASSGDSDLGVHYRKVNATYLGRGGNPDEAHHVAAAAIRALKETPDWSLGVVAVNKEQTDLIRAEFEAMLLRDRDARCIWDQWEGTLYPAFIKNLENVQGDERDRIIISTVYGPNTNGRVLQQFGPIVNQNGHRRLNVLYTRAKNRVDLFSSMSASDIRTDERSSWGLRAFHGYLDYAATLRLESGSMSDREPDSEFEVYVANALRSAGYEAIPQVGAGNYFIDIGVRHPSYPHGFLAGIECDGAMYHSGKSAKDRDALRQAVLEDMGWTIYRVWSTDWFNDPRGETQKLVAFLQRLVSEKQKPEQALADLPWFSGSDQTDLSDDAEDQELETSEISADNNSGISDREDEQVDQLDTIDTNTSAEMAHSDLEPGNATDAFASAPERIPATAGDKSLISVDQARRQLIQLRENHIQPRFSATPRERGLLRRRMLEELLRIRPKNREEFRRNILQSLRLGTDSGQAAQFLDRVLEIISRIEPV